jgi:predicted phosphodiesterase
MGVSNREKMKTRAFFEPLENIIKDKANPYGLPPATDTEWNPYIMPVVNNRILIMTDLHFPTQDNKAITAAIKTGKEQKVNTIILQELINFERIARFLPSKYSSGLMHELRTLVTFFEVLRKEFPRAKILYQFGNHEERFDHHVLASSTELAEVKIFEFKNLLPFGKYRIDVIDGRNKIIAGKMSIIHGHEFGGNSRSTPVNPARSLFLKTYDHTICGHLHKSSEHIEKRGDDSIIGCYSLGCLCELHPFYARNNKWNAGFGILTILDSDGNYHFQGYKISAGKVF